MFVEKFMSQSLSGVEIPFAALQDCFPQGGCSHVLWVSPEVGVGGGEPSFKIFTFATEERKRTEQ